MNKPKYQYETVTKRINCPKCYGSGYAPNSHANPVCDYYNEIGRCKGGKVYVHVKKRIKPIEDKMESISLITAPQNTIHRIDLTNGKRARLIYPPNITKEDVKLIVDSIKDIMQT